MLTSLLLLLPGLASSTSLRQHASDFSTRVHEVEEILLKPSAWSIYPPPPLPPRFLIVTSPQERIVSYSQIGDDYSAVKGLVKPLIQGGVDLPKGVAFDARHNRLFVADPGLKRIKAWTLSLERCLSPAEKAGLLGTGASSDPFVTDDAEGPTRCDLPWTLRASEEVTILTDVFSEWVSLDHNGNLYYSDQDRKSVNKLEASLLLNLVHGEVAPSDVSRRSASRAASEKLVEEGKEAMQIVDKAHDPLAFAADPMGSAGDGLKAGAELMGNMAKSAAALAPDLPLTAVGDTSVMELFQASSPRVVGEWLRAMGLLGMESSQGFFMKFMVVLFFIMTPLWPHVMRQSQVHLPFKPRFGQIGQLAYCWLMTGGLLWAFLSTFGFEQDDIIAILAALAGLRAVPFLYKRLLTLVATYPLSLTFKFASQILPKYTIEEAEFFTCDGASPEVAERRKNSIKELSEKWKKKYPKCQEFSVELKKMISDLRFTSARCFPAFNGVVQKYLDPSMALDRTEGVDVVDLEFGHSLQHALSCSKCFSLSSF
ncbi:mycA [Symbiodinium sp. CCMP2592]|nr:mycA [Symbiodinium sp. CCMP2592]